MAAMELRLLIYSILAMVAAGCETNARQLRARATLAAPEITLEQFQSNAAAFHSVVEIPVFETSSNQMAASVRATIKEAESILDRIGRLPTDEVNFSNTVRALADESFLTSTTENRLTIIEKTAANDATRKAASDQLNDISLWDVGSDYRKDVYRALKAYANTRPRLKGEDARLLQITMRDLRRAGLELPQPEQKEVEELRQGLSALCGQFDENATTIEAPVVFTREELAGVPEDFLEQPGIRNDNGTFTLMANVDWHLRMVEENAKREKTRLRMQTAHDNIAKKENVPLLEEILTMRATMAHKLGYTNWADYTMEVNMAGNTKRVRDFLEKIRAESKAEFEAEVETLRKLKAKDLKQPDARLELWDWQYYANELKKKRYQVDEEALKVYFPFQQCVDGMFRIYQRLFGLKFQRVAPPQKWVDSLQLYAVSDAETGEPMGLFYLDMFPRTGKDNGFAEYPLIPGNELEDGRYRRPVAVLICNFPPPAPGKPALLKHDDVATLFHEFGHVMHELLTRSKYSPLSGTSVPTDFVEAPSQMLEYWTWDKSVLDTFAADYRDPTKKIPDEVMARLLDNQPDSAISTRGGLACELTDLALHTEISTNNAKDAVPLANRILREVFFAGPRRTAWVAAFNRLATGYDASYYGYDWAEAIATDMATKFQKARDGYLDVKTGRRLRREIYEQGNSRDVELSVRKFLGRNLSFKAYFDGLAPKEEDEEKK
jgi:thimet oligopeptidase